MADTKTTASTSAAEEDAATVAVAEDAAGHPRKAKRILNDVKNWPRRQRPEPTTTTKKKT